MMHSTLVEKTENMATWKILRNGVTLDSGSLVADNESLSLPVLESKVVHGEKINIQIEDSTIGSKDMIDCTEDDVYLGPIGHDGITYDIYISKRRQELGIGFQRPKFTMRGDFYNKINDNRGFHG